MRRILYEALNFPLFQNRVYDTYEESVKCSQGSIHIIEDEESGLIYNASFDPGLMIYDKNYNNEQGLSPSFRSHLESVITIIGRNQGRHDLVEIGCGKGLFVEMLLADGFDVVGFDPSYEGDNPRIMKEYFKASIFKKSKGLILRHVLEHVPNPFEFLRQLRDANGGNGLIYIEVPCFDWICKTRSWFDIFYEHVNYFRMCDFFNMFGQIIESGRFFGNQYIYIVADLATLTEPIYKKENAILFPDDFLASLESAEQNTTEPTIVWGGGSKGVIFSLLRSRNGSPVSAVVDVNPAKQGRFLPVTGLNVLSPSELLSRFTAGSTVYIMNSNYSEEIKEMSRFQYNYVEVDQ